MISNYRIVEQQNLNGDVVFVPQYRKFVFFWIPFMELTLFPKRIEFATILGARNFLERQAKRPKEQVYYF